MSVKNGYTIIGELSNKNAGFCQWGFCKRDGREFFIKEFKDPVYPIDSKELSPKAIERKQRIGDAFFAAKKEFYDTLGKCRTGNNILVHDFFLSGSKYYIVTDRVYSSETEPSIIAALSREKKETFIRALLYSVARFHDVGIVHSDLKPDNILLKETVDGYYTPKIIDFDAGFLLSKGPVEIQGDAVYFAPESFLKLRGQDISLSTKIDVFALGILIHQYWTGELPKIGKEYSSVYEAVLDRSEVQLSNTIPTKLRDNISRMLSLDPDDRPSTDEVLSVFRATEPTPSGTTPVFSVPTDLG